MQTETLDKLYLEWSQFTGARTSRERCLADALRTLLTAIEGPIHPLIDPAYFKASAIDGARRALAVIEIGAESIDTASGASVK